MFEWLYDAGVAAKLYDLFDLKFCVLINDLPLDCGKGVVEKVTNLSRLRLTYLK